MPVIKAADGSNQYYDDRELDALRDRLIGERNAGTLTDDNAAVLGSIMELEERHARLRHAATRGATERIDNARAGYGQAPPSPTMHAVDRGGWLTAAADPHVNEHRRAGMLTVEEYSRSGVLASFAADRLDGVLRTGDPQGLTAQYVSAIGNPHYVSAFGKMLMDPQHGHLRYSADEVAAHRQVEAAVAAQRAALTTGTTGFPLPLTIDPTIIATGNGALNPVRQLASVITVGTHNWQGVSSDGVTATYTAEGVEATDASPTLTAPTIKTEQGRAFVQWTIESGQDWGSLQQQLVGLIADARDILDSGKFLTGTGTNEPTGMLSIGSANALGTAQRIQSVGTATFAVGDPWLLKAAIPARFIGNTTFAANPATWDQMYRFVGGNSTEPLQFDNGRGGAVMGRPKAEWSNMATGTASATKLIVGGDFNTGYKVVDRMGAAAAELIPHMLGSNRLPLGVRGMYVYWRTGAGVVAQNALRYLEIR